MNEAKHTPGPLTVRLNGTCSGAWAEIGHECFEHATGETLWRELARTETTHVERVTRGRPGTIAEKPDRFVLTEDGEEHIANAHLWAAAPELLAALQEMVAGDADAIEEAKTLGVPFPEELLTTYKKARAAIAKATGSAP
jgi:hypothetical protein